ncbi:MAG: hypothetical protein JWQ40_2347 [Segetibacter sp.]|nr:hypothetical protein [Segetibacter sp.]
MNSLNKIKYKKFKSGVSLLQRATYKFYTWLYFILHKYCPALISRDLFPCVNNKIEEPMTDYTKAATNATDLFLMKRQ